MKIHVDYPQGCDRPIQNIKAIRAAFAMGLRDAKDLFDRAAPRGSTNYGGRAPGFTVWDAPAWLNVADAVAKLSSDPDFDGVVYSEVVPQVRDEHRVLRLAIKIARGDASITTLKTIADGAYTPEEIRAALELEEHSR